MARSWTNPLALNLNALGDAVGKPAKHNGADHIFRYPEKRMVAMTRITIDIPERQVAASTAKAKAQGLTLEDWFRKVAEKEAVYIRCPSAKNRS